MSNKQTSFEMIRCMPYLEKILSCTFVTKDDKVFEILLNADAVFLFPKVNMQHVLFNNKEKKKNCLEYIFIFCGYCGAIKIAR